MRATQRVLARNSGQTMGKPILVAVLLRGKLWWCATGIVEQYIRDQKRPPGKQAAEHSAQIR